MFDQQIFHIFALFYDGLEFQTTDLRARLIKFCNFLSPLDHEVLPILSRNINFQIIH